MTRVAAVICGILWVTSLIAGIDSTFSGNYLITGICILVFAVTSFIFSRFMGKNSQVDSWEYDGSWDDRDY